MFFHLHLFGAFAKEIFAYCRCFWNVEGGGSCGGQWRRERSYDESRGGAGAVEKA